MSLSEKIYGYVTEPILLTQDMEAHNRTLLCIKATASRLILLADRTEKKPAAH